MAVSIYFPKPDPISALPTGHISPLPTEILSWITKSPHNSPFYTGFIESTQIYIPGLKMQTTWNEGKPGGTVQDLYILCSLHKDVTLQLFEVYGMACRSKRPMADLLSIDRQGSEPLRWSKACYYLIWLWLLIFPIENCSSPTCWLYVHRIWQLIVLEAVVTRPYSDSGVLIRSRWKVMASNSTVDPILKSLAVNSFKKFHTSSMRVISCRGSMHPDNKKLSTRMVSHFRVMQTSECQ